MTTTTKITTTKNWYKFKAPWHKATAKQIELLLKIYQKKAGWVLNNSEMLRRKLETMTVLQVSNLIEQALDLNKKRS